VDHPGRLRNTLEALLTLSGVAIPSLLVALAVRRWFERVSWRLCGLVLAISLTFIARGVFTPDLPVPLDEVMRGYPYRGIFHVVHSKNYLTNDTVKQIMPWMQTVREEFARGRAPLWNRHLFGGYPLLGNGQSAPFCPFFLATLFVPLPKQLVAMAGLKLFVCLLFGVLLIRREGVRTAAALCGAGMFTFCIFNNAFLYYPMTAVTLLLPAAAYGSILCLHQRRAAPVVLVALVVASLLAGGHPESAVHVAMAVVVLVAIEWVAPPDGAGRFRLGDLMRLTIASMFGVLISAPAWVPVYELVSESLRVIMIRDTKMWPGFPLKTMWAMIIPDGFGNPAHGNWQWIMSYTHVASVYVGLIPLVLLPGSLLSRRARFRDRLLIMAAIVFFIISMQWTWLGNFFYTAPFLAWVAHDRLRFVVEFLAGIVVARALARLARGWPVWEIASTAAVVVLAAYVFDRMYGRTLTGWSLIGVGLLLLFWIAVIVARNWPGLAAEGRPFHAIAIAVCVLTLLDLLVFTFDYNAITDRQYYVPKVPIIEAMRMAAPPEPFRVLGLDWVFLPNGAEQYGFEDVRGSDPMEWGDYLRFFRTIEVEDKSIDVKRINDPNQPGVDFLNVRFLMTEPGAEPGGRWRRIYTGVDGNLYENEAFMPRFFVPRTIRKIGVAGWEKEVAAIRDFRETALVSGRDLPATFQNPMPVRISARMDRPTKFKLLVDSPAPAVIASSQPALRWWSVRVGGKPAELIRVNGAFIGFAVPAGSTDVVVAYRPLSLYVAAVVSAVAAFGLGLYAWRIGLRPAAA
jgi:hypothetical protein